MNEASGANETETESGEDVRLRILSAATSLIDAGGQDAVTTRAICAAASVQAPTIYRLFGDKRGLLECVAEHGLAIYVAKKALRVPHADPVQELCEGWDMHVEFGLSHPGLFAIMSGDPRPREVSPAVAAGREILMRRIRNIALAGRLQVSEQRAMALVESMCVGTVIALLREPVERRDPGLSKAARAAAIFALTGELMVSARSKASGPAAALAAALDSTSAVTSGERALLEELLSRIANDDE